MKISIEISHYPLSEQFKEPIKNFIRSLMKNENIEVKPNAISTHVFGEFDEVMATVTSCMKKAMELPSSIFILKILNSDRNKEIHL